MSGALECKAGRCAPSSDFVLAIRSTLRQSARIGANFQTDPLPNLVPAKQQARTEVETRRELASPAAQRLWAGGAHLFAALETDGRLRG